MTEWFEQWFGEERRARERTHAGLVGGDMRTLPFRDGSFALAVNLFTSFGYFLDDAEHRLVVRQVAAALSRRGHFVLDYPNAEQVRRSLARAWGRGEGPAIGRYPAPRRRRTVCDQGDRIAR